jgi:hypothetical protein
MEYEKFNSVAEVQLFANQLPRSVQRVINLPWRGGDSFKLDLERVQFFLDKSKEQSKQTNKESSASPNSSNDDSRSRNDEEFETGPSSSSGSPDTDSLSDEGHVLLPFSKLVNLITSSMNCRNCRATVKKRCLKTTTIGIATSLTFCCDSRKCGERTNFVMEADVMAEETPTRYTAGRAATYTANWRLLLVTQLFGESQKAGEIIAGFLGLAPAGFQKPSWPMETKLGVAHEKVTAEIMFQNLKEAIKNIPPDESGRVPLCVGYDMGWQMRGRSYNSLSGHAFLIDVRTVKVVGMAVFSKTMF